MASVVSETIIEAAQDTGTQAVIKSPHLARLTPLVSLLGRTLMLHHLKVMSNKVKKTVIRVVKANHNQY